MSRIPSEGGVSPSEGGAADQEPAGGPPRHHYVMVCLGLANGIRTPYEGMFLKSYDPNGDERLGLGVWTPNPDKAKRYSSPTELFEEWRSVRTVGGGIRTDGRPDRPLTAFTVESRRMIG